MRSVHGETKVKYITSKLHSSKWRHKPQEKKKMSNKIYKVISNTTDRVIKRIKVPEGIEVLSTYSTARIQE